MKWLGRSWRLETAQTAEEGVIWVFQKWQRLIQEERTETDWEKPSEPSEPRQCPSVERGSLKEGHGGRTRPRHCPHCSALHADLEGSGRDDVNLSSSLRVSCLYHDFIFSWVINSLTVLFCGGWRIERYFLLCSDIYFSVIWPLLKQKLTRLFCQDGAAKLSSMWLWLALCHF